MALQKLVLKDIIARILKMKSKFVEGFNNVFGRQ